MSASSQILDPVLVDFLCRAGLLDEDDYLAAPLTGGVASDIWKVVSRGKTFVVKKALSRLRVAQEWTAPVSRNASEVDWLVDAASVVPDAVPQILARDSDIGAFAMTFLDPSDHPVWKSELKQGRADPDFAGHLGRTIAAIHGATAGSPATASRYDNDGVFFDIRLEPYLMATGRVHPDLDYPLRRLARDTLGRKIALVHGDVSPKNILVGPKGPVVLDAECAWYGDPAFDIAFCLNHLLLKCLWTPAAAAEFLVCFESLAASYLSHVSWEDRGDIEARIARLLPALLLARVDGKSPVEYVTDEQDKAHVRNVGRALIVNAPVTLEEIKQGWAMEIAK